MKTKLREGYELSIGEEKCWLGLGTVDQVARRRHKFNKIRKQNLKKSCELATRKDSENQLK